MARASALLLYREYWFGSGKVYTKNVLQIGAISYNFLEISHSGSKRLVSRKIDNFMALEMILPWIAHLLFLFEGSLNENLIPDSFWHTLKRKNAIFITKQKKLLKKAWNEERHQHQNEKRRDIDARRSNLKDLAKTICRRLFTALQQMCHLRLM